LSRSMTPAGNLHPDSPSISRKLDRFRQKQVDLSGEEYRRGHEIAGQIISSISNYSSQFYYLPHVYIDNSFLAGSLGRRTQERPLDDIDLYLVVNGGDMFMNPDGNTVPINLYGASPNYLATDFRYKTGEWISSWLMLQAFQAPVSNIATSSGAVSGIGSKKKTLYFRWSDLNVDLGFVLWGQAPRQTDDRYYLPKGNSEAWWSATNPKLDQQRLSTMNQAGGGQLLPLIRMMKWWNRYRNQDRLKGIHLEVMVENAFRNVRPAPLFPALCYTFNDLKTRLTQSCSDPTELGGPLDSSLSSSSRIASKQQLEIASTWLLMAALEIQRGNDAQAEAYIKYVFPIA